MEEQEHLLPTYDEELKRLAVLTGLRTDIYKRLTAQANLGQTRIKIVTQAQLVVESLKELRWVRGSGYAQPMQRTGYTPCSLPPRAPRPF